MASLKTTRLLSTCPHNFKETIKSHGRISPQILYALWSMVNPAIMFRSLLDCSAAEEARTELQAARTELQAVQTELEAERAELEAERAELVAVRAELDAEKKKNLSTKRRLAQMTEWSKETERTCNQVLATLRELDAEDDDGPR